MSVAIYPGTFDPVTCGHLDILIRATRLFDKVIIAVAASKEKNPLFSIEERIKLIEGNIACEAKVEVTSFDCLLVDFAREKGVQAIVRGLRAVSDFEFEFQLTQMNRYLDGSLETIFLMPTQEFFFTSSAIIKQVARYHGNIEKLVPANVVAALAERYADQ